MSEQRKVAEERIGQLERENAGLHDSGNWRVELSMPARDPFYEALNNPRSVRSSERVFDRLAEYLDVQHIEALDRMERSNY